MDVTTARRAYRVGHEPQGPPLHAVVIGEPIESHGRGKHSYPLSPLSPSRELPYALLPICNTPLIDYLLENLVENGVSEVTIMLNPGSAKKVRTHLEDCGTARGKPWLTSDAIRVNVLECARDMKTLADAVNEIRDRNVVPQTGSFLLVPIDAIAYFDNLREYYHRHLERVKTISKYAATLLCVPNREALVSTLHNVLIDKVSRPGQGEAVSPLLSERGSAMADHRARIDTGARTLAVSHDPTTHHTMLVLNKSTNVVTYMARFELGDEQPDPPLVKFDPKVQQSVRLDLQPTGFLFCCCEALALVEFHVRDTYSFLNTSLLGQVEVFGNVFGVMEVPREKATVEPVNSLMTYIQANLDVCARRLFPLTRESCFAEEQAKYAVSSQCETFYLHTSATARNQTGPNVVLGENVVIPASAELTGTVCGANVQIGEGASLIGCVVLDGAVIGRNCTLRGSVIGYNAVIRDNAEVVDSIIGAQCIIGQTSPGSGGGVVVRNEAIACESAENGDRASGGGKKKKHENWGSSSSEEETDGGERSGEDGNDSDDRDGETRNDAAATSEEEEEEEEVGKEDSEGGGSGKRGTHHRTDKKTAGHASAEEETDHWVVGTDGRGKTVVERWFSPILPTRGLFTDDPIPKAEDSDEDDAMDEEEDEHEAFQRSVKSHVELALQQPSHIEASAYDMSTLCLSSGMGYPELCEVVTELLMEHLEARYNSRDSETAVEAARDLFGRWCRPFYNNFLSKGGTMNMEAMVGTLEGLCAGIRHASCIYYACAPQLVEILYNGCDDDMYDERGYCIVSGEGLIRFDEKMTQRQRTLRQYTAFGRADSEIDGEEDDSSSDAHSRDSREEGKVLIADACHPFIMGVKDFLEAEYDD